VSAHFLCAACEERFSQNGEEYIAGQCARQGGQFPLRQLLATAPIVHKDSQFGVYDVGSVLGIDVEKFLYFAASVFWRAAAKCWTWHGEPIRLISLGPTYQEQFRLYLFGQGMWPPNARLYIHASCDNPIDSTTVFPCSTRVELAWRYKFCIPGILFILFLGGTVPRNHDEYALNSTKGHFIWQSRWRDGSLFSGTMKLIGSAVRARKHG